MHRSLFVCFVSSAFFYLIIWIRLEEGFGHAAKDVCKGASSVDQSASHAHIPQRLVILVIHALLRERLANKIQFEVRAHDEVRQKEELLLVVTASSHVKERRLVVELALREADLDLDLSGRIVVPASLDSFRIEDSQCERVDLCSFAQVKCNGWCGALRRGASD